MTKQNPAGNSKIIEREPVEAGTTIFNQVLHSIILYVYLANFRHYTKATIRIGCI